MNIDRKITSELTSYRTAVFGAEVLIEKARTKKIAEANAKKKLKNAGISLRSALAFEAWADNPGKQGREAATTRKISNGRIYVKVSPGEDAFVDLIREEETGPAFVTNLYQFRIGLDGGVTGTAVTLGKRINEIPTQGLRWDHYRSINFDKAYQAISFDPKTKALEVTEEFLNGIKREVLQSAPLKQPASAQTEEPGHPPGK